MKPIRRTQAQRTAATRALVLDAAVAVLVDQGFAGLSSVSVAQRAEVSRGALTHHFPSRSDLLGATVTHLFAGLVQQFKDDFEAASDDDTGRLERGLQLLWEAFERPSHLAVVELYVLARTDPEVAAQVLPAAAAHRQIIFELARLYFPDLCQDPRFRPGLSAVLDAMMGMTVMGCVTVCEDVDPDSQLKFLNQMFLALLQQPAD